MFIKMNLWISVLYDGWLSILGGDYMIPVGRDKILSHFAWNMQYYKIFINYLAIASLQLA